MKAEFRIFATVSALRSDQLSKNGRAHQALQLSKLPYVGVSLVLTHAHSKPNIYMPAHVILNVHAHTVACLHILN